MTESGFEMPPDHIVFQMLSTLDLSSPVIMTSPSILPTNGISVARGTASRRPGGIAGIRRISALTAKSYATNWEGPVAEVQGKRIPVSSDSDIIKAPKTPRYFQV